MLAKLLLALSVVAAAQAITLAPGASVSCDNGLFCAMGQSCMSKEQGAGSRLACSPHPNAVVCNDMRFSCPSGSTCFNELCTPVDGGKPFKASTSFDALSVGLRTYGNGVYLLPTDAPGLKGNLGDAICNVVAPLMIPNFCNCSSNSSGASVMCKANVGDIISAWIGGSFLPCGSPASIGYTYGASVGGQQVFGGSENYVAAYDTEIPIPGATYKLMGYGIGADANVNGTINNAVITANLGVDICGSVPFYSGCASQYPGIASWFDVSGTCLPPFLRSITCFHFLCLAFSPLLALTAAMVMMCNSTM